MLCFLAVNKDIGWFLEYDSKRKQVMAVNEIHSRTSIEVLLFAMHTFIDKY